MTPIIVPEETKPPKAVPKLGKRRVRDIILCVVIPVLLLYFDPIVFAGLEGTAVPASMRIPAYVLLGLAMLAFLLEVIFAPRRTAFSWFLSGALLAGSSVSAILGLLMLPFSLVGILAFGIGLLGLYPFFTSYLYFRTVLSIWNVSGAPDARRLCLVGAGFLMVAGIPISTVLVADWEIDRLTMAARSGADLQSVNWRRERWIALAGDADRIVSDWDRAPMTMRQREGLEMVYWNLRGVSIEQRKAQLRD